jgi:hypothetical protein
MASNWSRRSHSRRSPARTSAGQTAAASGWSHGTGSRIGLLATYWRSQRRDSHGWAGSRPAQPAWARPSRPANPASRLTGQRAPGSPATSSSHSATTPGRGSTTASSLGAPSPASPYTLSAKPLW